MINLTLNAIIDTMNKCRPPKEFIPAYELIESRFMTDWYELIKIKRTWKERLFTKPWMPLIDYEFEKGPQVPAMHVIIIGNKIIGHPVAIKGIAAALTGKGEA
jgi:hypothetical protein